MKKLQGISTVQKLKNFRESEKIAQQDKLRRIDLLRALVAMSRQCHNLNCEAEKEDGNDR